MWGSIGALALKLFTGFDVNGLVQSVVNAHIATVNAGTDKDKISADLIAREVSLAQREMELQASLTATGKFGPRDVMGYTVALFVAKILLWDKGWHLGVTDGLDPHMWWVVVTVIIAYCGSATVSDVITKIRGR